MNTATVRPCGLEVRPHDPSLLPELAQHFERSGFRVERFDELIKVERPDAPDAGQAAGEIEQHLRVWLLMNPDSIDTPTGR